ncbi:Na+/H+ antiporter subunit E [Luteimonas sp. RD2P54]|uniref:Na+/H+ antiporter subunit E n=1 Tax=Luteimonas endophytica TaxID=3042023 RepID=A0ABT6JA17_9GAMM|nr:Na+/H+ antiporter subunit E [Luteimonas endophytica]MDH5823028.1 Na+/H+ antiporter subunit E [Luteimonas endophytica]
MKRFLPSLPLSLAVFVLWLLLVATFSVPAVALGLALAVVLPLFADMLRPERASFGRLPVLLKLGAVVLLDIVRSNIEVARLILGPERAISPGFVQVPLDIANIHGITALASIITLTPGTVSAELSEDRSHLLVHCFNLRDPEGVVATIKARYEAPLKEIFP